MKATNEDQNNSNDNLNKQQSLTGSEGGQGFPQAGSEINSSGLSDEEARRQDERNERGYNDQEKGTNISHGSTSKNPQAKSHASMPQDKTGGDQFRIR